MQYAMHYTAEYSNAAAAECQRWWLLSLARTAILIEATSGGEIGSCYPAKVLAAKCLQIAF